MSENQIKESLLKKIRESSYFHGEELSDEFKKDPDIARAIIEKNGYGGFDRIDGSFKLKKEFLILAYNQDNDGYNSNASKENYVPREFLNDAEVVSAAVRSGWSFDKVPSELKNNKQIIMAAVKKDPRFYEKLSEDFKKDEEILIAAFEQIKSFYSPLKFASEDLKKNKTLILKIMELDGKSLEHVGTDLKKDREVVLRAVQNNGWSLQHADIAFQSDREIVMYAAKSGASNYIDKSFKTDEEVCLALIQNNVGNMFWCDDSLKNNKNFILKAIEKNSHVTIEYPNFNSEPEIVALINQGKAIAKLSIKELFGVLKSLVPDGEFLCFAWDGGGDSFGGYRLKAVKHTNSGINEKPLNEELIKKIQEIMDYSAVIEELELNIGWVGSFTCRGGLVIALYPLSEPLEWQISGNAVHSEYNVMGEYDEVICSINLDKGYQGLSISGEGAEEVTDWDNVEEGEDPEPQYDTNYFDRTVPIKEK